MAKKLADEAGYIYVDTGAMYRAFALFCMRNGWIGMDYMDEDQIKKHLEDVRMNFRFSPEGKAEIYLNDENVEKEIRNLEVSNAASRVSTLGYVRKELVRQQQLMGIDKGIVMDGRDIGTVVFPDAELKIFLTASPEVRARRRFAELVAKNEPVSYEEVLANVKERDERDQNREESPLKQAADALLIDNSNLTPAEQQEILRNHFEAIIKD